MFFTGASVIEYHKLLGLKYNFEPYVVPLFRLLIPIINPSFEKPTLMLVRTPTEMDAAPAKGRYRSAR